MCDFRRDKDLPDILPDAEVLQLQRHLLRYCRNRIQPMFFSVENVASDSQIPPVLPVPSKPEKECPSA
jgi:hypothetical protein